MFRLVGPTEPSLWGRILYLTSPRTFSDTTADEGPKHCLTTWPQGLYFIEEVRATEVSFEVYNIIFYFFIFFFLNQASSSIEFHFRGATSRPPFFSAPPNQGYSSGCGVKISGGNGELNSVPYKWGDGHVSLQIQGQSVPREGTQDVKVMS